MYSKDSTQSVLASGSIIYLLKFRTKLTACAMFHEQEHAALRRQRFHLHRNKSWIIYEKAVRKIQNYLKEDEKN